MAVAVAGVALAPDLTAGFGRTPAPATPDPAAVAGTAATPAATSSPTPASTPAWSVDPSPLPSPTVRPTPAATPEPTPEPTPALDPPVGPGRFAIDLSKKSDFVTQYNKINCVPASMQVMMNIIDDGADRSRKLQERLYKLARKLSTDRLKGDGAEPEGWARGLNRLGYGPYEVSVAKTRGAAIRRAAKALRMTGKPVGLLVWRGAHGWVMSGFKATADPAYTNDFEVTHVQIEDVWYPRVSSIWGPSGKPGTLIPVARLREDYLRWKRPTGPYPDKDGRYVLVIPVRED